MCFQVLDRQQWIAFDYDDLHGLSRSGIGNADGADFRHARMQGDDFLHLVWIDLETGNVDPRNGSWLVWI